MIKKSLFLLELLEPGKAILVEYMLLGGKFVIDFRLWQVSQGYYIELCEEFGILLGN